MNKNRELIDQILRKLEVENRMPLVEIHQLTPVGPSLLNRDFNNRIKTAVIGGTSRMYLSAACQRRPIRISEYDNGATRSKLFPALVAEALKKEPYNKDEEYCMNVAQYIAGTIGKYETGQILAFDNSDVERVAKEFAENIKDAKVLVPKSKKKEDAEGETEASSDGDVAKDEDGKKDEGKTQKEAAASAKALLKSFEKLLRDNASGAKLDDTTALMGRMSTDSRFLRTVVSALHMNHAYSTSEWAGDSNCFVSIDDYKKNMDPQYSENQPDWLKFLSGESGKEEDFIDTTGSAMMDDMDLASNTFYRYASISVRTLVENKLSGIDDDADEKTIEGILGECADIVTRFIMDYVFIVPTAKQTENATTPRPLAVLITAGTRVYPQTADAEFEKVIRATETRSVGEQSVERLAHFMDNSASGAFAVNEYQRSFWITDQFKDKTPKACREASLMTALDEISALIAG
ncbi:MAG: type I-E CRISPR-associated protein Cas7/Cse4/CasC [Lachnospiraceae bacterium]|nr:type I-E CRISPR-associated protein Cas7/Cse4/CasC [Lachnospiraceae bacterium]